MNNYQLQIQGILSNRFYSTHLWQIKNLQLTRYIINKI